MANTIIYYPLIKKGFQEVADVSSIESDITQLQSDVSMLQSNKVTKCINAVDLAAVADGEIFEWQGVETIINGTTFENGFFYKKAAGSTYTIPAGSLYFDVLSDIVTDLFTIPAGRYYQLEQVQGVYAYGIAYKTINDVKCSWLTNYGDTMDHVGNYVCFQNGDVTTITELSGGYAHDDSAGNNLYSAGRNNFGQKNIFTFVSDNGNFADFCMVFGDNSNNTYITGKVINGNYCPWNNSYFVGTYFYGGTLDEDYTVDTTTYTRIDTQPRLQNITNGAGGSINIGTDVNISGDLTVKGTQTVVHTEEIESENDYIELRADNPLGLASGEMSGIEVNNYDGLGTDCVLAVDNAGWARVGDKNGTLQKLATIQETPTDGDFVKYNNTTKELESTTDGSSLTVTFISDENINNIESGDTLSNIAKKIQAHFAYLPTYLSLNPSTAIEADTKIGLFKIDGLVMNIIVNIIGGWNSGTLGQVIFTVLGRPQYGLKISTIGDYSINTPYKIYVANDNSDTYIYISYPATYNSICYILIYGLNTNTVTNLNFQTIDDSTFNNILSLQL